MSWRQPAAAISDNAAIDIAISRAALPRMKHSGRRTADPGPRAAEPGSRMSVRDFIDVPRTQALEEVRGALPVELRIGRFDRQEKPLLAADFGEARHVEHRVIRHWQAAQQDPAEYRGKR